MLTSSGNNLKWACGQQTLTIIFSKPCLKIAPLVSNGGLKRAKYIIKCPKLEMISHAQPTNLK